MLTISLTEILKIKFQKHKINLTLPPSLAYKVSGNMKKILLAWKIFIKRVFEKV